MSRPRVADPAKLVVGLLVNDRSLLDGLVPELVNTFGTIEAASRWLKFEYTQYYTPEMGAPLWRRLLVFRRLCVQDELAFLKLRTNELEEKNAFQGKRSVNIDPGLLVRERFVLATGKNFSHRIYLSGGIYADLTLIYRRGGFQTLPWTYPDYADQPILEFLTVIRKKYVQELKTITLRNDS